MPSDPMRQRLSLSYRPGILIALHEVPSSNSWCNGIPATNMPTLHTAYASPKTRELLYGKETISDTEPQRQVPPAANMIR